ncbi:hypothetical protein [Streptomyces graminilatus]|uniref:hypothetical protein n=1 Tax=Streptomyces graminilatus TaxID=1464070 RepID=UPI000AFF8E3E|nr:hypothetical protein [Streptomyces graminilatus]
MQWTVSWPSVQRFAGAFVACAALAATSGCGPAVDAVTGVSVTDDGRLVGVLMVCGHHLDGATLYVDSGDVDNQATVGSWTAARPLKAGLATWTLETPGAGWTATTPLKRLTAKTTYALYGWTKDDSWSAISVSFTLADRDRLTPGMVRYEGDESAVTVPVAEFKARACEDGY